MPSPWYALAAVGYCAFIVLCCLVASVASDREEDHALIDLCATILESEGD